MREQTLQQNHLAERDKPSAQVRLRDRREPLPASSESSASEFATQRFQFAHKGHRDTIHGGVHRNCREPDPQHPVMHL
jgi:hypothetical protein